MKKRMIKNMKNICLSFVLITIIFPTNLLAAFRPVSYVGTNKWGSNIYGGNDWYAKNNREYFYGITSTSANNAMTYVRANARVFSYYTNYTSKNWDVSSRGNVVSTNVSVGYDSYRGGFMGAYSEHSHYDSGTSLYEKPGKW